MWCVTLAQTANPQPSKHGKCWPIVYDAGPTITQHWFNVSWEYVPAFGPLLSVYDWFILTASWHTLSAVCTMVLADVDLVNHPLNRRCIIIVNVKHPPPFPTNTPHTHPPLNLLTWEGLSFLIVMLCCSFFFVYMRVSAILGNKSVWSHERFITRHEYTSLQCGHMRGLSRDMNTPVLT